MADKKMSGNEFVETLRQKIKDTTLLKNHYFVIVGQQDNYDGVEDTSVVLVKNTTKRVLCAFSYDTNGLIYNMSFGGISFAELIELTDLFKSILDRYNYNY